MTGRGYNKLYDYSYGGDVAATPTTADGFYNAFRDKNDMEWSGGDQVTSFYHNGFTYWMFGDSMLSNGEDPDGSYPEGSIMVSNRILLQNGDQFSNAIANAPIGPGGNGIPDPATNTPENQHRYWTQGMFAANGHLYVIGARVQNNPDPNSLGFMGIGVELAKYTQNPTTGRLTLVEMCVTPSTGVADGHGPLKVQWSGDAIVEGGYVYFYGATLAKDNPYVIHYSYVARVPVAELENPYSWRFYKKTTGTWVSRISELDQDVVNQTDAILAGQVSSVRKIGTNYVMVHKPWNGWGSDVKATTAPNPWGPWSPEVTIFSSPEGTWEGYNYQTYSPQLHPEQVLASGKTLVSIAWNGKTLADVMGNADLGKPRFEEVQF